MNGVKITLLFFSVFISTFNADENEETTVGERLHPFPAGAPFDRSIIVSRNVANVSPSRCFERYRKKLPINLAIQEYYK
jgi:hypothetical protein